MKIKIIKSIFSLLALSAASHGAVTVGSDLASDTAYNSGWTNGTDGGTIATFGAWALANGGVNSGHFIGNSAFVGSPGADINSAGESFGMFGHSGQTSEAFRDFNGNSLGVGQTFSLNLAVNFRNGQKGFDLRNSADAVIFNFNVGNLGGVDDYAVQFAASGNGSIGNTYSANSAFMLAFTQTSGAGGSWTITRSGGVADLDSGTYLGVAENFKIYNSNTSGGAAENNLFANSFTVVPEPTSAALGLIGSILLLRRRK